MLPHTGASFDGYTIEADPNNPSTMYADTWTLQVRAADTSTP